MTNADPHGHERPPVPVRQVATWRDRVFDWMFQQGVSTILLLGLSAAVIHGGRWWLTEGWPEMEREQTKAIQEGYERLHDGFNGDLKMVIEAARAESKSNRELFERLLQELKGTRRAIEKSAEAKNGC